MHAPRDQQSGRNAVVATAWAAVVVAAVAVAGLMAAPSLQTVWIVLLILAVAAVPQALVVVRRESRERSQR